MIYLGTPVFTRCQEYWQCAFVGANDFVLLGDRFLLLDFTYEANCGRFSGHGALRERETKQCEGRAVCSHV